MDAAFLRYVHEKIHLLKRRQASGKIESSTGFLLNAIRKNYANPEFAREEKRQQAAEARKVEKRRDGQKKRLEEQLEDLKAAYNKALTETYAEIAESAPEVLEAALPGVFAEQLFLRQVHERDRSALENYRSSPALASLLNPSLERHAPERLQAVRAKYALEIAALEQQIASL